MRTSLCKKTLLLVSKMKTDMDIVLISLSIAILVTSEFANCALLIALKYLKVKAMQVSLIRRLSVCYMLYGGIFGLVLVITFADGGQFFATGTINCALQGILFDAFNIFIACQMLLLTIERYYMIRMDDIPKALKKHSGVIQGSLVVASVMYALSIGCVPDSYHYIPNKYRCTWSLQRIPLAVYFSIGILPSVLSVLITLLLISVPIRMSRSNSVMPQTRYDISIIEEERNGDSIRNSRLINEKFKRSASAALLSIPISLLLIAPRIFNIFDSIREYSSSKIFHHVCNFVTPFVCLLHPCILLLRNKKMASLLTRFFCCKLVAMKEKRRSFRIVLRHPLEARENESNILEESQLTSLQAEITTIAGNDRRQSKIRISNGSSYSSVTKVQKIEKSDSESKKSKHSSSISTKITTHAEIHKSSRSSNASSVSSKVEAFHIKKDNSCDHSQHSKKSSLNSQISIKPDASIIQVRTISSASSSEYGKLEFPHRRSDSNGSGRSSITATITIQGKMSDLKMYNSSSMSDPTAKSDFESCSLDSLAVNFEDASITSPSISPTFDSIQMQPYSQSV